MSPPELGLRPFEPADAAIVSSWMTDEAATVAWGGPNVRFPLDVAQWEKICADPDRSFWTPTLGGAMAGHFQLRRDERCRLVRFGRVAIAPALRGRGLGSSLARLACDTAFGRDRSLHRVELQVYEQNVPAWRAYTRAGFVSEGVQRENLPVMVDGAMELWSTATMSILRREWEVLPTAR